MNFGFDQRTHRLVLNRGMTPLTTLPVNAGDTEPLDLSFFYASSTRRLPGEDWEIQISVKNAAGDVLAIANDWTFSEETASYRSVLDLNTQELHDAFGDDKFLTAFLQLVYSTDEGASPVVSQVVTLTVRKQVASFDDLTPAGLPTPLVWLANALNTAASKTSPVDADTFPISDSEASGALKKMTFANLFKGIVAKAASLFGIYTPWLYGAVGDGSTDDRASLQAVIDACGGAGGGTIVFGAKTYKVDESPDGGYCLKIPHNNVRLVGQGASSRIACASATATTILVAEDLGPYDSETPYIDNVEIREIYFNPLVQKENNAREIHCPSTRHFKSVDCHYGRREGMTTGVDVPPEEESKIGTFASIGDVSTAYAAHALFQNTRGFGHYRFIEATNIADLTLTGCGTDSNRVDAQSIRLYGGASVTATNCDFVNSAGFLDSWDACLLLEEAGGRVPSFCKFTNIYFDTHKWAIYATAGFDINFTNCWTSGKNSPGIYLGGTADRFLFAGGEGADNRQEGIEVLAGNHTFRDWTVFGVAKVIGETDTKSAIYIGPDTGIITLANVRVLGGGHGGIAATAALKSLSIAAGPKRVEIIGGEYHDGISDLSGLVEGVTQSSMIYWLRPSGVPNQIDGRIQNRWANSLVSKLIARAHVDAARPAFRSNVDGVPCFEFNKGGRTGNCLRLHDESAGGGYSPVLVDFTITAMVKITGDAAIFGKEDNNWNLRLSSAGIMSIRFAGAGTTVSSDTPLTTPMGEWVLLTWRRTGGTIEFIENGVLLDTQAGTSTEGVIFNQIGGFNGTEFPVGYIAEVVIRDTAESDPSLAALTLAIMNSYPSVFSV